MFNFISRLLLMLSLCAHLSLSHSREYNEGEEMIPILSESIAQESMSITQTEEEEYSFSEDEIIPPFYDYIDQLPRDLWKEIMARLEMTQIIGVSATCKSTRSALMTFDFWKFFEKFMQMRCELESLIISYPKLFSSESHKAFVWPEETQKIVRQIAKIMRSGEDFVFLIQDHLCTYQDEDSFVEGQRKEEMSEKMLKMLGKRFDYADPFEICNMSFLLETACCYPPLSSNTEAQDDLIYLLQRTGYTQKKIKRKLKKDTGCNRIFRNRWVVAGLSASAAIVGTGVLYAYLHKFPSPMELLLSLEGNVTLGELWNTEHKFPSISQRCIDNRYGGYYWQHAPARFFENIHWDYEAMIRKADYAADGGVSDLLSYLTRKYPGVNTTLWKEFILESKFLSSGRFNLKGICTVDLDETSLTCGVCEKSRNNIDFHLKLTHIDGVCAQNRWLFSLMNFVFLSVETISLPVIGMIFNFLGIPDNSSISAIVCAVLIIPCLIHWILSLLFAFAL